MFFVGAFNDYARTEIKERSKGRSELSGEKAGEEGSLLCGHLDHTRNENYNNPEFGLRITKFEECAYHQMHIFNPGKIGMDELENKSVVTSYMGRFFKKGFTLEEVKDKIGEAIDRWEKFLEARESSSEAPRINETPTEAQTPRVEFEGLGNYIFKDDSFIPE
jgi:hypothetical protein